MFGTGSHGDDTHVHCSFAALLNMSAGCTCDGSCEFGCIGDDSRASLLASQVINSWIQLSSTKQLLNAIPPLIQTIAEWNAVETNVDTSLDIIR
jgi:hypothetical protein